MSFVCHTHRQVIARRRRRHYLSSPSLQAVRAINQTIRLGIICNGTAGTVGWPLDSRMCTSVSFDDMERRRLQLFWTNLAAFRDILILRWPIPRSCNSCCLSPWSEPALFPAQIQSTPIMLCSQCIFYSTQPFSFYTDHSSHAHASCRMKSIDHQH